MPNFSLELAVPAEIPVAGAKTTFYWASNPRSSFESTYDPHLLGLGPVASSNVDFVRVAAAVFAADRSTPREWGRSDWNSREIGLCIPVYSPDLWQSVKGELTLLLGLLTGDVWKLNFSQSDESTGEVAEFTPGASRVVLVSGGADSAIGALTSRNTLGDGGHILVSHVGATGLSPIQRNVAAEVENLVPGPTQTHLQVNFRRKAKQANGVAFLDEWSTRSRSLLFLAFGLAVASREAIPLWIPENGFASLNPPLGPDRRGSLSTRTTHPAFLEGLTSILEKVGAQSDIHNPFASQTKGEMFDDVAHLVGNTPASEFLSVTHSCGLTGQRTFGVSPMMQCGVCFGCVMRRASFQASGIQDNTNYIAATSNPRLTNWLGKKSIESSVRAFVRRGIRVADIAALGLPRSYSSHDALDLCNRGLTELQGLYQ